MPEQTSAAMTEQLVAETASAFLSTVGNNDAFRALCHKQGADPASQDFPYRYVLAKFSKSEAWELYAATVAPANTELLTFLALAPLAASQHVAQQAKATPLLPEDERRHNDRICNALLCGAVLKNNWMDTSAFRTSMRRYLKASGVVRGENRFLEDTIWSVQRITAFGAITRQAGIACNHISAYDGWVEDDADYVILDEQGRAAFKIDVTTPLKELPEGKLGIPEYQRASFTKTMLVAPPMKKTAFGTAFFLPEDALSTYISYVTNVLGELRQSTRLRDAQK